MTDQWWKWQVGEVVYPIYRLRSGVLSVWKDERWQSSSYLDRVAEDPEFIEISADEAQRIIGQKTIQSRLGVDAQLWPKHCLIEYPNEFEEQIDIVQRAVRIALQDGIAGRKLIRQVDSESMKRWYIDVALQSGIWRAKHSGVLGSEKPDSPKRKSIAQKRMVAIFRRDNWRCRYCGIRVGGNRKFFEKFSSVINMPELVQGRTDETRHGLYSLLMASYDHITPHSRGGSDDDSNLVTACWGCQFGKFNFTLEELGLQTPDSDISGKKGEWQGVSPQLAELEESQSSQ